MDYNCTMDTTVYADYMDEKYFEKMYPKTCKRITTYIDRYLDDRITKSPGCLHSYPTKREIDEMIKDLYEALKDKIKDLEDEIDELKDDRQYGRTGFLRPLVGVLLLDNLLRRRRRIRRPYADYGVPYFGGPFGAPYGPTPYGAPFGVPYGTPFGGYPRNDNEYY